MARVTVEDCVLRVPNRFDLVMVAAQRARDISSGADITVARDSDKNPVVALREIAENSVDLAQLEESIIRGLRRNVESDEPEESDGLELLEQELADLARQAMAEPVQPRSAELDLEDGAETPDEGSADEPPAD